MLVMRALLIMMVIIRSKGVVLEGFAQGGFLWIGIGKVLYVFGFVPLESNYQEKTQIIFLGPQKTHIAFLRSYLS